MEFIELEKIYRQKDDKFIRLLNAVRNRSATAGDLSWLNEQYRPNFEPKENDFYIYLTATNEQADNINARELNKLTSKLFTFKAKTSGDFGKEYLPTAELLALKSGAQIMMLNNDSSDRWINGTVGKILSIKKDDENEYCITAKLQNGRRVSIYPYTWDIFRYYLDGKEIQSETVGSFTQFPVRLAFAITIHKSQGKTFDRIIIDIGKGAFAHGQVYVALSRATALSGTILKKRIHKKHIIMDFKVMDFLTKYKYRISRQEMPIAKKVELIKKAIEEKKKLKIIYLKTNDEKSTRIITPELVGDLQYANKTFLGMAGYCFERGDKRVFRVDRILKIELI